MAASSNLADQADAAQVSYEDLALLEEEFDDVDLEIMRKQYDLSAPLYTKRALAISRIPNFWALVLEQVPPEIDQYIQPHDSRIFAESLANIEVTRPELESKGTGNPRSVTIKFEFQENEDFEDTVLEKTFWHRRAKDGWVGLVSEPVKIQWKKGKDLTQGLTDEACALFAARKKAGDMTKTDLPEYETLKKKVESWNGQNTSFFTWFGWVSSRRYVSAEESSEATAKHQEEKSKRQAGDAAAAAPPTEAEIEAEIEAADDHDEDVEVHQAGEEVALAFAEEVWPNAIKLFTEAQEGGDISDAEFEDMDEDEDDEDAEGGDEAVDIAALVGAKGKGGGWSVSGASAGSGAPPSKKQKR